MANYFSVSGYWKDAPTDMFGGYIVKDTHKVMKKEDDRIFFYGLTEKEIKENLGKETNEDFVITSYHNLGTSI
jgi:hypothetical protein